MQLIDADWIKSRLTGRHGEKSELARKLGLAPDAITKILAGTRRIQPREMPVIWEFFAEPGSPEDLAMQLQRQIEKLTDEERRFLLAAATGVLAGRQKEDP